MPSKPHPALVAAFSLAAVVGPSCASRAGTPETSTFEPARVLCQAVDSCTILLPAPFPSPEPVAHQFDPGLLPEDNRASFLRACLDTACKATLEGAIPDPRAGVIAVKRATVVK